MYCKTIIIGRLTRDTESKIVGDGLTVCKFSLAYDDDYKKDEVNFIECIAWNKTGDLISKYFTKGKAIFIEGRLKQERWEDKDGMKRSRHVLNVEKFKFYGNKENNVKEEFSGTDQSMSFDDQEAF